MKYKDATKSAAIDALRKSQCVATTPSQTADKLLLEAKKPMYIIHDEVCQASDATSLMPLYNNRETVVRHIQVGDPKQLGPVVKSVGKKLKEGEIGNPFGPQLQVTWFSRLQNHGLEYVLLHEQFRQAAGLSNIINQIFYDGQIVDGEGTELTNRPEAVEAIKFIEDRYHQKDNIPHICLSVPDDERNLSIQPLQHRRGHKGCASDAEG